MSPTRREFPCKTPLPSREPLDRSESNSPSQDHAVRTDAPLPPPPPSFLFKNGNFSSEMAQEEEDGRQKAHLQEEEKVRVGSSGFYDQNRRLPRPFGQS